MKFKYFIIIIIFTISCKNKEKDKSLEKIKENDYIEKQGYINKIENGLTYARESYYHVTFTIIHDSIKYEKFIYKEGDFLTNEGDPVIVYVNINNPKDFYLGYKGIKDKKNLRTYLIKTSQELSPMFKNKLGNAP